MRISRGQFIKLERGERKLTERTIALAARAFGVSEADVIADRVTVPLVGFVGAGAEAHFYAQGQGPFDEVPGSGRLQRSQRLPWKYAATAWGHSSIAPSSTTTTRVKRSPMI